MPDTEIRIPQLGEGLQEARLVRFLKQPGDSVRQDEPLYEMETDKAVMEIESPVAGVVAEWTAKEDDVLPIGAVIGRIAPIADCGLRIADCQTAATPAPAPRPPIVGEAEAAPPAPNNGEASMPAEAQRPEHATALSVEAPPLSGAGGAGFELKIPQLGEGLHEARIVRFLKQPGEAVVRDEPLYEMETDKAVMEIESPVAGVLEAWTAHEDDVLPIGAVIGRIADPLIADPLIADPLIADCGLRIADSQAPPAPNNGGASAPTEQQGAAEPSANPQSAIRNPQSEVPQSAIRNPQSSEGPLRNAQAPPRTRAYAKRHGVSDAALAQLAAQTGRKLLPADIDRYLARAGSASAASARAPVAYADVPLPQRQRTLVYRLQRSAQVVIPATIEQPLEWRGIEETRERMKREAGADAGVHSGRTPSQFLLFAWCVAQASRDNPRFRAALVNDSTLRQYERLHLGIAVARPDDELVMARVPNADALGFDAFVAAAQDAIERARHGEDQTAEAMQLSLTSMTTAGVRVGIPVVVAPAVGTLFIGTPFDEAYSQPGGGIGFRRMANMVFTFDHRIANGIGAARFLTDIQRRVESLTPDALRAE